MYAQSIILVFLIPFARCSNAVKNANSYFTKCVLNDENNLTLSCILKPFVELSVSSKVECANHCAFISRGLNKTLENQVSSSNYTGNKIIGSFLQPALVENRSLEQGNQFCLGFNYQDSNETCQLFDQPCLAPNVTTITGKGENVYYTMASEPNLSCFFRDMTDCSDIPGSRPEDSGVYWMNIDYWKYPVYCDIRSSTEKYMVFQRRFNGSLDFYRGWAEYEHGFGDIEGEHWLGNYLLYRLTNRRKYKLRVEVGAADGGSGYSEYLQFNIGPPSLNYMIAISGYSGTAGDSLAYSNGMQFTTLDRDNDLHARNCAVWMCGAWWYKGCTYSNLNGIYNKTNPSPCGSGLVWVDFRSSYEQMRKSKMLLTRA